MVKTAFFAADRDEGAQRGSGRPIPPLVTEIQAATTNTGTKPQGGLTPRLFGALQVAGEVPVTETLEKRSQLSRYYITYEY